MMPLQPTQLFTFSGFVDGFRPKFAAVLVAVSPKFFLSRCVGRLIIAVIVFQALFDESKSSVFEEVAGALFTIISGDVAWLVRSGLLHAQPGMPADVDSYVVSIMRSSEAKTFTAAWKTMVEDGRAEVKAVCAP